MERRAVLVSLAKNGVTHVLPMLDHVVRVDIVNLEELRRQSITGLCISDYANAIDLKIAFDEKGRVTRADYGSVQKFSELSGIGTRAEVLDKLYPMLKRDGQLMVATCIPDARWIALKGIGASDVHYLEQFPIWSFDEPGAYSSARLSFVGPRLEKIKYIWRPFESL